MAVRVRHVEEVMGTVFTVDAVFADRDEAGARHAVTESCRSLHDVDDLFSTWRATTPMSRLRSGDVDLDEVPQTVREVLDECRGARAQSGGWFDPWAAPGGVDPTGYVKGWAGQQVLESLRDAGAVGALVNAAGDVVGFGGSEPTKPWRLGVTDPFNPHELLGVVPVQDGALAVSGTYERGDHVYDPTDGAPAAAGVVSAAVTGPDLGLADALATAMVAGGERALLHVARLRDYEALVIFTDRSRQQTANFPLLP